MKKFNIRSVNRALAEAGILGELVRGEGYFYFAGPSFFYSSGTSVYVYSVNDQTLEQWVAHAREMIADSVEA